MPTNPYMRDALVDEMEQEVNRPQPVGPKYPFDQNVINQAYQTQLGREAGEADYEAHRGNPGGEAGVLQAIAESPEAAAYKASQAQPQTAGAAPPPSTGSLGASGATAGRYAGFDTQRAQDPSTSAKDAFLAAATASGSMPESKDDAEAWFNQYILKALTDAGYQVDQVVGDKAFVRTRENPGGEWIDFLQNAGGENPMIAWQSEVNDPSIGGEMGGAPAGAGGGGVNSLIDDSGDVMGDIDAAIQKMLESGMSFEDIMAILQQNGAAGA